MSKFWWRGRRRAPAGRWLIFGAVALTLLLVACGDDTVGDSPASESATGVVTGRLTGLDGLAVTLVAQLCPVGSGACSVVDVVDSRYRFEVPRDTYRLSFGLSADDPAGLGYYRGESLVAGDGQALLVLVRSDERDLGSTHVPAQLLVSAVDDGSPADAADAGSPDDGTSTPVPTPTAGPPPTVPTPAPTPAATASPSPVPSPPPAAGTATAVAVGYVSWQGASWQLLGVNLPWRRWACDFGGSSEASPGCAASDGVQSAESQQAIGGRLAQLSTRGIPVVRWWIFPGDPWQIAQDDSGQPTAVREEIFADIDAALALAEQYDVSYVFVLFSAPSALPEAWMESDESRQALAASLAPLFARYAGHPRLLAWEVFNEPEWDAWAGRVNADAMVDTAARIVRAIHENGTALATIGSAHVGGLPFWTGVGLDFYQAHWYDPMMTARNCARCTDYAALREQYGLDRPLVIGEFYAGPDVDALQRLEDFRDKGYAGAWAWSLFPESTNDQLTVDLDAFATFRARYDDIGP